VRFGGGLIVAATGWRMLRRAEDNDVHAVAAEKRLRFCASGLFVEGFFRSRFR
jgi:hypothetical protein